jgi:Domain of unknown function (DUF932)
MFDLEQYQRGTHTVPREILHEIPLPPAGERTRWKGLQFGQLADSLVRRVERAQLIVTGERWSIDRSGQRMFGYLSLDTSLIDLSFAKAMEFDETGNLVRWETGYGGFESRIVDLRLAVVHSNDSSLSLRLCVFPVVLVCDNGLCVDGGWIACQKKHTKNLHLIEALDQGIHTFLDRTERIGSTIETLKSIDLSNERLTDHILVEAGRKGIIPWSKLGHVEREWGDPQHPEFAERTGWGLYNAFTEIGKEFSMIREMQIADESRKLILAESARS